MSVKSSSSMLLKIIAHLRHTCGLHYNMQDSTQLTHFIARIHTLPRRCGRVGRDPLRGHDARRAAHHHSHLSACEHAKRSRTRWRVRHRDNGAKQVPHSRRGDSLIDLICEWGPPPRPQRRYRTSLRVGILRTGRLTGAFAHSGPVCVMCPGWCSGRVRHAGGVMGSSRGVVLCCCCVL